VWTKPFPQGASRMTRALHMQVTSYRHHASLWTDSYGWKRKLSTTDHFTKRRSFQAASLADASLSVVVTPHPGHHPYSINLLFLDNGTQYPSLGLTEKDYDRYYIKSAASPLTSTHAPSSNKDYTTEINIQQGLNGQIKE
jgi:hypothetical protein